MKKNFSIILLFSVMLSNCSNSFDSEKSDISQEILKDTLRYNENILIDSLYRKVAPSIPTITDFVSNERIGNRFCTLINLLENSQSDCSDKKYKVAYDTLKSRLFVKMLTKRGDIDFFCKSNYANFKSFILPEIGFLLIDNVRQKTMFVSPPSSDYQGIANRSIGVIYFVDNTSLMPYLAIKKFEGLDQLFIEKYDYNKKDNNDFYGYRSMINKTGFKALSYKDILEIENEFKNKPPQEMDRIFLEGHGSFREFPLWTFNECLNCFQTLREVK